MVGNFQKCAVITKDIILGIDNHNIGYLSIACTRSLLNFIKF